MGALFGGRAYLAALPDVLPLAQLWRAPQHERWLLLAVSPRWTPARNAFGVPGAVQSLITQSALRSSHGSASPYDLHAVLIANGPSFRRGVVTPRPTGAIDVAPTTLALLGMTPPASMQGRIWWEMIEQPQGEPGTSLDEWLEPAVPAAGVEVSLQLHHVGETTYVQGALQPDTPWERAGVMRWVG